MAAEPCESNEAYAAFAAEMNAPAVHACGETSQSGQCKPCDAKSEAQPIQKSDAGLRPDEKRRLLEAEALPLRNLVYSVARRMVGDAAVAEDLVQEIFLRAFRSVDQYQLGTNCKAWLLSILRSVYVDASRQVKARGGVHKQLPTDVFAPGERTDLPVEPSRFMAILDGMVDDDVRRAILQVPDAFRDAFMMVVMAELPYKEAAGILGVQEGTVKSRVFRACRMLKEMLWDYAVERRIAKGEVKEGGAELAC